MPSTDYTWNIRVNASAPGDPRPVALAARIAKLVGDTLAQDGFALADNAVGGVYVECNDMTYVADEAPAEPAEAFRTAVGHDSIVALLERAARERQVVLITGRKLGGERYYDRPVRPCRVEDGGDYNEDLICIDVTADAPRKFYVRMIEKVTLDPSGQGDA